MLFGFGNFEILQMAERKDIQLIFPHSWNSETMETIVSISDKASQRENPKEEDKRS